MHGVQGLYEDSIYRAGYRIGRLLVGFVSFFLEHTP